MAVIALVALVVIGPKDLPGAMRTVGHWVRKIRLVARDFQSNLDDMIRESELDDARKAIESTKSITNPGKALKDTIDPTGDLDKEAKDLEKDARDVTREANAPVEAKEKAAPPSPKESAQAASKTEAAPEKAAPEKAGATPEAEASKKSA